MSTTSNRCIANRARCQFAKKCDKFVQTRGLCKAHGGNSRCRDPQCNKPAQSRGLCIVHGGGRRCQFNRCKKLAQSKGYCITHGGGRRCIMANCDKFSQVKGRCKFHSKVSTVESSSPPIAITTSTSTFAISPTNAKLSMEFLANPLSRSSFMGDKVLSTYPQIQMPTVRSIVQLTRPDTRARGHYIDNNLVPGYQQSLVSFFKSHEFTLPDSARSLDTLLCRTTILKSLCLRYQSIASVNCVTCRSTILFKPKACVPIILFFRSLNSDYTLVKSEL